MSVLSPAVLAPSPPLATLQPETESSFDARWAAWIKRGREGDLATKRKVRVALLGAAVIALPVALFFAMGAR